MSDHTPNSQALAPKITRRAALAGLLATGVTIVSASRVALAGMRRYRWKNRPLLVFAPHGQHASLRRQQELLSGRSAQLRDRDMVVILVVGDRVSTRYGPGPGSTAAALRKRYGVGANQFATLLVGKDTGVKRRSGRPLTASSLFALIDSMPMRRQEMRSRKKAS